MRRLTASGTTQTIALSALASAAFQQDREIDVSSISVDRVINAEGQVVMFHVDCDTYPDDL